MLGSIEERLDAFARPEDWVRSRAETNDPARILVDASGGLKTLAADGSAALHVYEWPRSYPN